MHCLVKPLIAREVVQRLAVGAALLVGALVELAMLMNLAQALSPAEHRSLDARQGLAVPLPYVTKHLEVQMATAAAGLRCRW